MKQETIVKCTKILVPTFAVIGVSIFATKFIKEVKAQVAFLNEQLESKDEEITALIEELNKSKAILDKEKKEHQNTMEQYKSAVFDDIDENGEEVDSPELEEMRKRFARGPIETNDEGLIYKPTLNAVKSRNSHHSDLLANMSPSQRIRAERAAEYEMEDELEDPSPRQEPKIVEKHNAWEENKVYEADDELKFPDDENAEYYRSVEKLQKEGIEVDGMRYEPNSPAALQAYKNMVLVDYDEDDMEMAKEAVNSYELKYDMEDPKEVVAILDNLFSFNHIKATNEYDQNVIDEMTSRRKDFFGENSKYVNDITFAEVIIYFVEKLQFDFGYSNAQWAYEIICNLGLLREDLDRNGVMSIINSVMHNDFYGPDGFGIFGIKNTEQGYSVSGEKGRMWDQYNSYSQRLLDMEEDLDGEY